MSSNITMKGDLCSFLDTCRISSGEPFTHTTKPCYNLKNEWIPGAYRIPLDIESKFYERYNAVVYNGIVPTLTEKPGEVFPLHVDIDFKYDLKFGLGRRIYTTLFIKRVVKRLQWVIKSIADADAFCERMVYAIVTEKPNPRSEGGYIKDGMHIQFPHFICDAWTQDICIHNELVNFLDTKDIMTRKKYIRYKANLKGKDIVDTDIGKKVWCLYGSMNYKGEKSLPYLYNRWDNVAMSDRYGHAYDHECNEFDIESIFVDELVGRREPAKYWMPSLMSIRNHTHSTPLKQEYNMAKAKYHESKKRRKKTKVPRERRIEDIMMEIKMIEDGDLMSMLSTERAMHHDTKMEVGWCLYGITDGLDIGLELWKQFCQRADDYIESKCVDRWDGMKNRGMRIGTLFHWAKNDSPDLYNRWRNSQVDGKMNDVISEQKITEGAMSIVGATVYKDRFVCANKSRGEWYEFRGNRWYKLDAASTIFNALQDELKERFLAIRHRYGRDILGKEDDLSRMDIQDQRGEAGMEIKNELRMLKLKQKGCGNAITFLNQQVTLKNTISMMANRLLDDKFTRKLDRNKNLIGFDDGVLDLEQGRFRLGRPDDYITMTTGNCWADVQSDPDAFNFIENELFGKIYTNVNIREYAKKAFAIAMKGGNTFKNFYVLVGKKDSGKTKIITALQKAFGLIDNGGYCATLPPEILTRSTNQRSDTSPAEVNALNCRWVFMNELTPGDTLNVGFFKLATGNDGSFKRGLYDNKGTNGPHLWTSFIQCNELPKMPGDDEAAFERTKIVDHQTKFVLAGSSAEQKLPVPKSIKKQFKLKRFHADKLFDDKLDEFARYIPSYLLNVYKECNCELDEPAEVVVSSANYRSENDVYKQFIEDYLEKVTLDDNPTDYTYTDKALFLEYAAWYKQFYDRAKKDDLHNFRREMCKDGRLGQYSKESPWGYDIRKRKFMGWKIKLDENDDAFVPGNIIPRTD